MFFGQYEDDELVVKLVVSALDLVLTELNDDKHHTEESAESTDTVEGVLNDHGRFRKMLERVGLDAPPIEREELLERLSRARDHTEEKSGAYEKRIAEIEALKSCVQSKDVLYETSEKILEILMVGLARSSSRILDSMEWGHNNVREYLGHMTVYARAINAGFDADVETRYPFDM